MSDHKKVVCIESDPSTIRELCLYDQGYRNDLSVRAMEGLDILTVPKDSEDDTVTALGFVAMLDDTPLGSKKSGTQVNDHLTLVESSRPLCVKGNFSNMSAPTKIHNPDGVYALLSYDEQAVRPLG